jgi:hypothetical protein
MPACRCKLGVSGLKPFQCNADVFSQTQERNIEFSNAIMQIKSFTLKRVVRDDYRSTSLGVILQVCRA